MMQVTHLSRLGLTSDSEEVEETQARRLCTFAKQTGARTCIRGLTHLPALEVVKEFRSKGAEIWAELSDKVDRGTMQRILEDKSLSDLVIMAPASEVTDLAAHVKMASDNPLRSGRNILSENWNKNRRLEK